MAKTLTWLVVGTILAVCAWRGPAVAQMAVPGSLASAGGELISHFHAEDGKASELTIIDSANRVLAVYHLHRDTGEIQLKSVRNIRWDFAMEEFNGADPLPAEIRKMVERNRP